MNHPQSKHVMFGAHVPNTRLSNGFSKPKRTPANFALVREAANGFLRERGIQQYGARFEQPMPKRT